MLDIEVFMHCRLLSKDQYYMEYLPTPLTATSGTKLLCQNLMGFEIDDEIDAYIKLFAVDNSIAALELKNIL